MCGICGIIEPRGRCPEPAELEGMLACLAHRGPDDSGTRMDGNVALGQSRLSIIDLSPAGRQPMSNEDGTVWIVYNGEFYNYADYFDELKRDGHVFRSRSDTEVILHLYEKYGLAGTISRMMGMFAFFLWDQRSGRQFLVRDRLGIKPLYYFQGKDRLAFASEIKAFYPLRDFRPVMRDDMFVEGFLFNGNLFRDTLLKDVYEVRPGTWLELEAGGIRETRYYDLARIRIRDGLTEEEALEEFDARLTTAVKRRLVSDVPVGVFLSGGVDSTILALKTTEVTGGPINTISVAYPEDAGNEFRWSDQVAARIRSVHHKKMVDSDDFFRLYPWITYIYDGPVSTGAGFYKAAKVAKEHCSVMLCGQGSDEVFAGYSRYLHADRQVRLNRILASFLPAGQIAALSDRLKGLGRSKLFRKVCARLPLAPPDVAASYSIGIPEEDFHRLLAGSLAGSYNAQLKRYSGAFPGRGPFLNNMLEMELGAGLQQILQQTDRLTMASAVETRVPFLDHELVEFAFSLPVHLKMRNGVGKYLLKKYLMRHFPASFVMRPKMGFPTPVYQWFMDKGNPIHRLLEEGCESGIGDRFNVAQVRRFAEQARRGGYGHSADVIEPLMRFLGFTLWWKTVQKPDWALSHRPEEAHPSRLRAKALA